MIDFKDALKKIELGEIKFVDMKFTDLRGTWQHFTIAARDFTKKDIEQGYGFDGSSIRGFQEIYESDLILIPDVDTIFIDPFMEGTLSIICDVYDPISRKPFPKDPRFIARNAEAYLKKSKIGDISYWGPEPEFFVFDKLDYRLSPYSSYFSILSTDKADGESDEFSDGYPVRTKAGYFPTPPFDKLQEFRSEMFLIMESLGIEMEVHHHEVATAGQVELDLRYDSLLKMADKIMIYKYVARNLAKQYGMTAVFLPKPIFGDNGTGMHTHQSIFKEGKNMFYDPKGYAELSKTALSYIGGILSNIESILGITNSTLNSYRRLVPHFEAPTAVAFSKRNRSAAIRIPMYTVGVEKAKRIEFRCPDPTTNPYLAFSAMLVAGISGVNAKLDPVKLKFGPFDENIWEKSRIKQTPGDLMTTLNALKKNPIFAESGVFSKEILESYIDLKVSEAREVLMYPTPSDYHFYGDI